MAQITAADVKTLRDETQLPMMDCKRALEEAGGDREAAIRWLREKGLKTMAGRSDRSTEEGRIAIYAGADKNVAAMIELQCESAPVAGNEDFRKLAAHLAEQLATGPGAATAEELWSQPSPGGGGTLQDQCDALQNKIREVFRLSRFIRVEGTCGGYVHHDGKSGVLLQIEGGNDEAAKQVSMQIVAMRPAALSIDDLDSAEVAKEREILSEQARQEGKPEKIIEKMVEGRMRNYYAERVLLEQPFVKDDKQTVGEYMKANGIQAVQFIDWRLGQG